MSEDTVHDQGVHDQVTGSCQGRLWTPWRMRYVAGAAKEEGCLFCNRRDAGNDVEALVLYRGRYAYVILNLFPYNTGHVMLVPTAHVDALESLPHAALGEMAELAPRVTASLRRVLNCDGFNLGLNIGAIAGAGVAEHLHQHVVPRWRGDANFMPIVAGTMVLPELIPSTYAKVRAELERELLGAKTVTAVILVDGARAILLHNDTLPTAAVTTDVPVWRSALTLALDAAADIEIVGWAGRARSGGDGELEPPALALRGAQDRECAPGWTSVPVHEYLDEVSGDARRTVERALVLSGHAVTG